MIVVKMENKQELETPRELYDQACEMFKVKPVVDVAATRENTKCEIYFAKQEDGLAQEWIHDSFLNPPYNNVKPWVKKAYEQNIKHNISVLALLPVKTDTSWFHDYILGKSRIYFIRRRVRYCLNGIPTKDRVFFPSMWVLWEKRQDV